MDIIIFLKNFIKELSEALENFNLQNKVKGEKMEEVIDFVFGGKIK